MRETPEQMLTDIEESSTAQNGIRLSAWEEEFIDSIEHQIAAGRTLTEKQQAALSRIWERA